MAQWRREAAQGGRSADARTRSAPWGACAGQGGVGARTRGTARCGRLAALWGRRGRHWPPLPAQHAAGLLLDLGRDPALPRSRPRSGAPCGSARPCPLTALPRRHAGPPRPRAGLPGHAARPAAPRGRRPGAARPPRRAVPQRLPRQLGAVAGAARADGAPVVGGARPGGRGGRAASLEEAAAGRAGREGAGRRGEWRPGAAPVGRRCGGLPPVLRAVSVAGRAGWAAVCWAATRAC